jgi:hypothetical protein
MNIQWKQYDNVRTDTEAHQLYTLPHVKVEQIVVFLFYTSQLDIAHSINNVTVVWRMGFGIILRLLF